MYGNVFLSEEELRSLREKYPDTIDGLIEQLSVYLYRTHKKYRSHYLTLLSWARRERQEAEARSAEPDYSCEEWESL